MKKHILILVTLVIVLVSCSKESYTPAWEKSPIEKQTLAKTVQENNPFISDIINGDTVRVVTYFNKNLINGKSVVVIYLSRPIDRDVVVRYWYHSDNPSDPTSIVYDLTIPKGQRISADLFPNYYPGTPIGGGWLTMGSTGRWILR